MPTPPSGTPAALGLIERMPAALTARYRPVELIAQGGFGTVWKAEQVGLHRAVALKVLHPHLLADAEAVARFDAEARMAGQLIHPSIVRVIDHGRDSDLPWIAFEYLPAPSLHERLRDRVLPWESALDLGIQIASALNEAHSNGILHRDVKPDNLLDTGDGTWKLADFGVAKWTASAIRTEAGVVLGTPAYSSPQILMGQVIGVDADLYALGVVLYEAISGRTPLWRENVVEMVAQRLELEPAPLAGLVADLPPAVEEAILRAIARDPHARYATAADFVKALEEARRAPPRRSRTGRLRPYRAIVSPQTTSPKVGRMAQIAATAGTLVAALIGYAVWPRPAALPSVVAPLTFAAPAPPTAANLRDELDGLEKLIQQFHLRARRGKRPGGDPLVIALREDEILNFERVQPLLEQLLARAESIAIDLPLASPDGALWLEASQAFDRLFDTANLLSEDQRRVHLARRLERLSAQIAYDGPDPFRRIFTLLCRPRIDALITPALPQMRRAAQAFNEARDLIEHGLPPAFASRTDLPLHRFRVAYRAYQGERQLVTSERLLDPDSVRTRKLALDTLDVFVMLVAAWEAKPRPAALPRVQFIHWIQGLRVAQFIMDAPSLPPATIDGAAHLGLRALPLARASATALDTEQSGPELLEIEARMRGRLGLR